MKKCEFCGQKVNEDERSCPSCGEKLKDGDVNVVDSSSGEYIKVDTKSGKEVAEPCDAHQRGKNGKAILISVISVLLVAAIATSLVLTGVIGGGSGSGTVVVASLSSDKLSNAEFAYYYWGEYYYLDDYYSQYYGVDISYLLDPELPLDEQEFANDGWATWHDYFCDMAVETWANTIAIYNAAIAAGHQLDDSRAEYLGELKQTLEQEAENYGFYTVDAMLKADYGRYAGYDSYYTYIARQHMAYSYAGSVYEEMYGQHIAGLEVIPTVNIRHILFFFEDFDDALAVANATYDEWKANPTEEFFAQLAEERSADEGSVNNGGLYEEVYPGQMVETFNDWCFDPSRKVGDSGIVETQFGYHIMYYSGVGEQEVPKDSAAASEAESLAGAEYDEWFEELLGNMGEREIFYDNADVGK